MPENSEYVIINHVLIPTMSKVKQMEGHVLLSALLSNLSDLPFNLEFAVTYRCNSRCLQCNVWRLYTENPGEIAKELTCEEIEKKFSSYGRFSVVGITGGEPFLRDDLPQIIDIISKTQKKLKLLFITTNGQFPQLTGERVRKILDTRSLNNRKFKLQMIVSLDGPKDLHNYIRGLKDAYDKSIDTIGELAELRAYYDLFDVGTDTVLSPFNINRFDDVIGEIWKLQLKYNLEPTYCIWFEGQLYKNFGCKEDVDVEGFRRKLTNVLPKLKEVIEKKGTPLSKGRSICIDLLHLWLKNPEKQVIPCGGSKVRYFLAPNGDVYPCTIFGANIGNIRDYDYDFTKLIHGSDRKRIRQLVSKEKCPICWNTCEAIPTMMAYPWFTAIQTIRTKWIGD